MASPYEIKKEMCEIGRRVYQNGFVAANDGNFSVKVSENEFYCTPTGVSKGFMTPDMIIKVDGQGNMLEPNAKYRPSSEFKMHLGIYRGRPDVNSVVHAHPPIATAHACCGIPLDTMVMPEVIIALGEVPIAKYGTPSTEEIPDAVAPWIVDHDAVLLENHGALSWGQDLMTAYFRMETLEYWAKINMYCKQIGTMTELDANNVMKLMEIRKKLNVPGRHPGCKKCLNKGTPDCQHGQGCNCGTSQGCASSNATSGVDEATVRAITQQVLEQLG